jgi:hypothetical protein
MKRFLKQVLETAGYEVKKKNPPPAQSQTRRPEIEQEADSQIGIICHHTMLPYARLFSLYEQAVFCETAGLPGCFVECGTWKGGAAGLMALANMAHAESRRPIHLFDSFEGIPEPDETVDGVKAVFEARQAGGGTSGRLVSVAGFYQAAGTLEVNRELLEDIIGYDPAYLYYHKGWFQDTLPREARTLGEIALLHLDGDWYASTKVCLEYLYDQVVSGGFVVIDDYGCYEGCRRAVDEFLQRAGLQTYLHRIDSEGRYWVKP